MALKHAVLVSLAEKAASGYELARRFDKSLGFFWRASHQQIYQVLAKLEASAEIIADTYPGDGKPDRKVYRLTEVGKAALAAWTREPTPQDQPRSEFAVKVRGMAHGDRAAVVRDIARQRDGHRERLAYYLADAEKNFPEPRQLSPAELPLYLVLRGGIRTEEGYVAWCEEMLELLGQGQTDEVEKP